MSMTPREIVHELNRHIIGQDDAKRAVAIALRNRWRRMQLPVEGDQRTERQRQQGAGGEARRHPQRAGADVRSQAVLQQP